MTTYEYKSFAHIAPGPYRFVGLETEDMREERKAMELADATTFIVQSTNNCGGTCDHCGTPIFDVYTFKGSNGVKFKVGCDCAEKAFCGDEDRAPLNAMLAAKKKLASKRRAVLASKKDKSAREWLTANIERLASIPSPNERRAEKGETAADWASWMLANAGKAGVQKTYKTAMALI
jgi:hypothetical protein